MVRVTEELALSQDEVTLYHTTDHYLGGLPVLVFHGPSTTTNSTLNSSRIQIHVFTAAGFQSYPRITISPNSPLYQAVNFLPRERQGEEVCRGLAFGLLKYFRELPEVAKAGLIAQSAASGSGKRPRSAPKLFAEQHVADLVHSMVKAEHSADIVRGIEAALRPQNINHVDVDLVLPPGSIAPFQELDPEEENMDEDELLDPTLRQYGVYGPLVKLFGEVSFLPTSKLRRAPSKPTSLNRTRSFLKDQKMSLRREMGELVDTEERYVIKMHELVNHIADDFRQKARERAFGSFSPSEDDLQKLFPKSLDRILAVNSAFLAEIRRVMDETEEDAMRDLEAPIAGSTGSRYGGTGRLKDPTGALAFAKVLLEWFPQFQESYQDYIRASQDFPQIITIFVKQQSSFSHRVQQTGEQRLRSAVIEPVQRLPRYSLFIDNIVNYLPVLHPALQSMLKARDIITSICSLDPPETDKPQIVNRLRNLIEAWPPSLHPKGRLITAVDFVELPAPFDSNLRSTLGPSREGMFMLFSDCVVILRKASGCNLSARGLLAEIDKPSAAVIMSSVTAAAGGQKKVFDLSFCGWHILGDTRFTMSDDGHVVTLVSFHDLKDPGISRERIAPTATLRSFLLQSAYDGKAAKFMEEVVRAKVEGRFAEAERESDKWRLRSIKLPAAEMSLHTAVFEEGLDTLIEGRKEPASVRIVIDHHKGTKGAPIGHYGVDIVANVTMLGSFKLRLDVGGLHNRSFSDEVVTEHFLLIFVKRLNDLLRSQFHISNPALTAPFISYYTKTLKSLHILTEGDKVRSYRPASPVKLLSNLFSSGFNSSSMSVNNPGSIQVVPGKSTRAPVLTDIPSLSRTNSNKSIQDIELKSSLTRPAADERPTNPLVRLEETFTGYISALLGRKGNVVGRALRNRATADELSINAIYNSFIENPFDQRAADEVSVDVLFVAFEKYLRMAWREQMGQVMSVQTLDSLQEKALKAFPGDFADYVRMVFGEMAPQNRRAFIAIVKLLADLLDGCGNDADRGALTVAFAELLVIDGNPHDYINLLDRMIEDHERLFDDIGPGAMTGFGVGNSSVYGSVSRSNKSATGSVASNASSFRRRFAETVLGQKGNKDGERPPLWRTLSKTTRSVATGEPIPSTLSKGSSLNRSRSIESPGRRPASRDRPTVLGAFDERPSSSSEYSLTNRLSTIGASPPPDEKKPADNPPKKKRRSSLSDLKSLMAAATLGGSCDSSPEGKKALQLNSSPRTPSPTKIPVAGGIMDRNRYSMYRTGSPLQKGDSPSINPTARNVGSLTERPQNIMSSSENGASKDTWSLSPTKGHGKSASLASNIPTLRGRAPSATRPMSSPQKPSPQKLRLQSPQKLRERLQNEAKAINEAEATLQTEISRIGEEMAKLNSSSSRPTGITKLSSSITDLESRIPRIITDFTSRNEAVKQDLERSLVASEFKVKGLDQLYKESSAENELLYEKFNGELGKIVKAVKGKGLEGKEDLLSKLREQSEETARVKKENARLRREVLTLRALLKGNE